MPEKPYSMEDQRDQMMSVLDNIQDVIYVADPESYTLLYVNEPFKANWGGDVVGKKCHKVLQDRDTPCPFCTNDKIFGDHLGETVVWEFQNEINEQWYRCSDKAISWGNGRMVRMELASNINEIKLAQEELKRHRDHLEDLVQERTAELEQVNGALKDKIKENEQRQQVIQNQSQEILELSTPVMQVWEGIVVAPLIGTLDSMRTQRFMEVLLQRIVDTKSPIALVDITGVPTIDTQTAYHIIETINAVNLLGSKVILTGVSPMIATTLIHLGVDLSSFTTHSSLVSGLKMGLDRMNLEIVKKA